MERRGRRVVLRDGEGSNRSARIEVWVEAGRVGRLVAGVGSTLWALPGG